jgi:hypothetical protein
VSTMHEDPCTTAELEMICTCKHTRGSHGRASGLGQCLYGLGTCDCDGFSLAAAVPAFVPDPLPPVETAEQLDLEELGEALGEVKAEIDRVAKEFAAMEAEAGEVVRLLLLAAKGRREYAKGLASESVKKQLEHEARAFSYAAEIAVGLDRTDRMKDLLPCDMWDEI